MPKRRLAAGSAGLFDPRAALCKLLLGLGLLGPQPAARALDSVLPLDSPMDAAAGTGVSAALRYFAGNDPVSARQYHSDWQGSYHPRNGLNVGFVSVRAGIGAQAGGWRLSKVARTELLVESGREMTDLMHLYKTRISASPGRTYSVDVEYAGYAAKGWRIDKAWRWQARPGHDISFGLGYSLLEGNRVRSGSAQGSLTSLGNGNYAFAVMRDDAYTGKTYPFQTPGSPEGSGGGIDLGLEWKMPQGARLEWIANDVLGRMRWRDIPGTLSNAGTGVTGTDANGYIVYAPVLSGRNARREFTQKLPVRWALGVEVPWRDFYVLGSLSHLQRSFFPLLGLGWNIRDGWRLQADYDFRFKTYGFKLAAGRGFIAVRASQSDLNEARAYGASAGVSWTF